ncbi:MAG: hypothetical protein HUK24_05225, partial [Sphaerochaetaceae bacterium]|nr:hypothetical protein [Sphaerochaetaceae bacterium]
LDITLRTPQIIPGTTILELEEYISDSLEKYGGILIHSATLHIEYWSTPNKVEQN